MARRGVADVGYEAARPLAARFRLRRTGQYRPVDGSSGCCGSREKIRPSFSQLRPFTMKFTVRSSDLHRPAFKAPGEASLLHCVHAGSSRSAIDRSTSRCADLRVITASRITTPSTCARAHAGYFGATSDLYGPSCPLQANRVPLGGGGSAGAAMRDRRCHPRAVFDAHDRPSAIGMRQVPVSRRDPFVTTVAPHPRNSCRVAVARRSLSSAG